MDERLRKLVEKIRDKSLRRKVMELLENPTIEIGGQKFSGLPLETSPAGISRHHCYPGGFIEHVLASAEIAMTLCKIVRKIYKGKVNQDYVLAGIILHDIFKPLTYLESEDGGYMASPLGEKLDHLTLAVAELIRRGFPLEVIHIVCAHHGYEAGPIGPKTVEALICHLADVTDSRLNGETLRAAKYLALKATGEEITQLTPKEAFKILQIKAEKGLEGLKRLIESMKREN